MYIYQRYGRILDLSTQKSNIESLTFNPKTAYADTRSKQCHILRQNRVAKFLARDFCFEQFILYVTINEYNTARF